jgi:hypothetical protein
MPALPSSNVIDTVKQPAKAQTADDVNDLFKELDSEDKVVEEKKEPKTKESKEVSAEDEADELELVEPEEETEKIDLTKDDDLEIEAPPRKKEILKKYPELFKDFPFMEKILYRDRQYNELFGSFDDAKEIAEKSEIFNQFESQLLSGNTEQILREVKETNEKAFNIIVDDYLPTLAKIDIEAYRHVVGNLNRRLIMEMVEEANSLERDDPDTANNLKQTALLVNQFIFGTAKFTAPARRVEKKSEGEQSETEKERLAFVQERFETSRDELQGQVDNTLRATISDYIDPKGVMSGYVKKNAVADAMKNLGEAIAADPTVVKNLDNLWRAAFENKFAKNSLDKIKSFYLSKAKANLKTAILKARAEALKDARPSHNREEVDVEEEEQPRQQSRRLPSGRPSQPKGKNDGPKKGESVTDFFMRD